jgi:hypothetical protein
VGQAGAGRHLVQGQDGAGEIPQDQQTMVEGQVHATVAHGRRQLDQVDAVDPGRDHEGDAVDDPVAEVGGQVGVALANQGVAAKLQIWKVCGV